MPSTFFGLNIAYTGLTSAQAAINTTGNNISNVETKGYSRQQAIQKAADALKTNTTYGMAGAGVLTTAIEQVRNTYYDTKYWNNNANLGEYDILSDYMKQIENYFMESETVDGFTAIYDDFYNALSEVKKTPGDDSVRAQFIAFASNLTTYFNEMATDLSKLQEDANAEIKNKTDEINSIATQVANLNKQINIIEMTGVVANELRDERSLLIDRLSLAVDVEIKETPIYTTEGGDELSGANKYTVKIAGQTLVDGYEYNTLSCVARAEKVNQSDAEGLYDVEWSNGLQFNLYGGNLGGELKGLIEIRDGNNEESFSGTVTKTGVAGSNPTVTVHVTDDWLTDLTKTILPSSGIININGFELAFDSWAYDSATQDYTFTLAQGENVTGMVGRDAAVGRAIDYQGIPYYQEQMNEWVRTFAKTFNDIVTQGQDLYGDQAGVLFIAENITDGKNPYLFTQADPANPVTSSEADTYYKLTAANFAVSHEMAEDSGKFTTTKNIHDGQDKSELVDEMLKVKEDKDVMNFRGCSSAEFLQCITADIALNANSANTFQDNFDNISNAISNQRLSVSGVDNDEEALNLVKFQNAYNLSSKMIQIMTEIYDRLILETGV